ncbi:MAG: hypothetical protein JWO80_6350 [Bryobacterales bacterium]|nr:hypothetical protein [Bryobacterales bacterium]
MVQSQSLAWIEEFASLRRVGGLRTDDLTARQVDAFLLLEAELTAEKTAVHNDATRQASNESAVYGSRKG